MNRSGWVVAWCLLASPVCLVAALAEDPVPADRSHVITDALNTNRDRAKELLKQKLDKARAMSDLMQLADVALKNPQALEELSKNPKLSPEDIRKLQNNFDPYDPRVRDWMDKQIKDPPPNAKEILDKMSQKDHRDMVEEWEKIRPRDPDPIKVDPKIPVQPDKIIDPQTPTKDGPALQPKPITGGSPSTPPSPSSQPEPSSPEKANGPNPLVELVQQFMNSESSDPNGGGKLPSASSFLNLDSWSPSGGDSGSSEGGLGSLMQIGKYMGGGESSASEGSGGKAPSMSAPSGEGLGRTGLVLVGLGIVAVMAIVVWRLTALRKKLAAQRHAGWQLGPWPVQPGAVSTREQLIKAFEYLAVLCLGRPARNCNHRQLADRLGKQTTVPEGRRAAESLAELYEHARYAPPDEPLPDGDLAGARRDLTLLAGGVSA